MSKFKAENKDKYKSTFDTEPPVRPSYIPSSYNNHTLVFNPGMRGYGYYDPVGTFILYDALTDIAMNDYRNYHTYHTIAASEAGAGTIILWIFGVGIIVIFLGIAISKLG